jgi:hypothetical protein
MSNGRPDLAGLLANPALSLKVPPDAIPSVLAEICAQEAELGTVKAILAARLASPPPANGASGEHDLIDDVEEAARIARHSVSWVRKNGHTLPGFRQPGGKGTRVAWVRAVLEAWASGTP